MESALHSTSSLLVLSTDVRIVLNLDNNSDYYQSNNSDGGNLSDSSTAGHGSSGNEDHPAAWIYCAPVILILGVIGNMMTLAVMRRPRLRGTTTSVYLQLLAVADTLALITRIVPEFFKSIGLFVFSDLCRWTCKLEKFVFYTSSDIAIWILVLFSVDRLIAVCFPLIKRAYSVPRRAYVICLLVAILSVAKNFHVFWSRDKDYWPDGRIKAVCGRPEPYYYYEEFVRPWIAFVLISAIPFLVILTCNILIIRTLLVTRYERQQKAVVSEEPNSPGAGPGVGIGAGIFAAGKTAVGPGTGRVALRQMSSNAKTAKTFTQTTLMCLSASVAFLICVTPSIVLTVGRFRWQEEPHKQAYYVARAVTHQLACLNHAINFLLYCLSGERFRKELLLMLGLSKRIANDGRKYTMYNAGRNSANSSGSVRSGTTSPTSKFPSSSPGTSETLTPSYGRIGSLPDELEAKQTSKKSSAGDLLALHTVAIALAPTSGGREGGEDDVEKALLYGREEEDSSCFKDSIDDLLEDSLDF